MGAVLLCAGRKGRRYALPNARIMIHQPWGGAEGKASDILALTLNDIGVSCINVPAGYDNPHKDDEYTVLAELERCLTFVKQTVATLHRRFPHEYRSATQRRIEELRG
jgi:hypothetical protein